MLKATQLILDFLAPPGWRPLEGPVFTPEEAAERADLDEDEEEDCGPVAGKIEGVVPDETLTECCRVLLDGLGLQGARGLVRVQWNARLRSTAGYASYPSWRIELNPRLREFEGQVERTMRHELAHLVAYHRAGRRRIEPHGAEWQQACADLGIPGENARHTLPLPRRAVKRNLAYLCPNCGYIARRVRKFPRQTACRQCCDKYSGGKYDRRFQFVKLEPGQAAGD